MFFKQSTVQADYDFLAKCDDIIFEGAQGLAIDQNIGVMPYCTRSNTGLVNIAEIAKEANLDQVDVTYMTRAYLTRHGAGPLPGELPSKPFAAIVDETNVPNRYQDALRFAWLDLDHLADRINRDRKISNWDSGPIKLNVNLGMTCLDQVSNTMTYLRAGKMYQSSKETLVRMAGVAIGAQNVLCSTGPTKDDVREL